MSFNQVGFNVRAVLVRQRTEQHRGGAREQRREPLDGEIWPRRDLTLEPIAGAIADERDIRGRIRWRRRRRHRERANRRRRGCHVG